MSGLREALEELASRWADQPNDYDEDTEQQIADGQALRALLAAHPAEPQSARSVDYEIPEAAVEAAARRLHPTLWDGQPGYRHAESARDDARGRVRLVLAAALPYLAPAEVVIDHRPGETCSVVAEVDPEPGFACSPAVPQPVDREALERLLETHGVFVTTYFSTDRVESRRRILVDAIAALLTQEAGA